MNEQKEKPRKDAGLDVPEWFVFGLGAGVISGAAVVVLLSKVCG